MNLSHLKAMVLVAEHGSFSSASRELYITPVSLMQQINLLENDVGFKIFNRSKRGVTLTEAGTRFYTGVKRSIKQLEILMEECREIQGLSEHQIVVGIYTPYSFIQVCNAYHRLHPEINFVFVPSEFGAELSVPELMRKRNCDIMQETYSKVHITAETNCLPIGEDYLCCYCSPSHPLANCDSLTLEQLLPYEVYYPSDVSIGFQDVYAQVGGQTLEVLYNELDIHYRCANGALFILEHQIVDHFKTLKCIPLKPLFKFAHGIVYQKNAAAHVQDFIHFVREQVGKKISQRWNQRSRAFKFHLIIWWYLHDFSFIHLTKIRGRTTFQKYVYGFFI